MGSAQQVRLFCDKSPALPCRRLQRRAQQALGRYAAGAAEPSFALWALAEEQARLELLRAAERRQARRQAARGSKLRFVEYVMTPAGSRLRRAVEACVRRIEDMEARLLCA